MAPVSALEESPFVPEEGAFDDGDLNVPDGVDLAEEFGGVAPVRDEDVVPDDGTELPEVDVVKKRIPEKTQVLMEELFRAKLENVQRVNPKSIR